MRTVTVKLGERVREVLLRARCEGNRLTLTEQLSREDYVEVNKAIVAAGHRLLAAHFFG